MICSCSLAGTAACDTCPNRPSKGTVFGTSVAIYDREEVHHNCTVVIWKNSVTGEQSIGWCENKDGDT